VLPVFFFVSLSLSLSLSIFLLSHPLPLPFKKMLAVPGLATYCLQLWFHFWQRHIYKVEIVLFSSICCKNLNISPGCPMLTQ
jgi:hypothetical protein